MRIARLPTVWRGGVGYSAGRIWARIPAVTASNGLLPYINIACKVPRLIALVGVDVREPPAAFTKNADVHSVHVVILAGWKA